MTDDRSSPRPFKASLTVGWEYQPLLGGPLIDSPYIWGGAHGHIAL